jgi:hypothetical protein
MGDIGKGQQVEGGETTPETEQQPQTPLESSQPQHQWGSFWTPDSPSPSFNFGVEPFRRVETPRRGRGTSRRGAVVSSRRDFNPPSSRPPLNIDRLPVRAGAADRLRVPESTNLWEISHQTSSLQQRQPFGENDPLIRTSNQLHLSNYPGIAEEALAVHDIQEPDIDNDMGETEDLHLVPNPAVP